MHFKQTVVDSWAQQAVTGAHPYLSQFYQARFVNMIVPSNVAILVMLVTLHGVHGRTVIVSNGLALVQSMNDSSVDAIDVAGPMGCVGVTCIPDTNYTLLLCNC